MAVTARGVVATPHAHTPAAIAGQLVQLATEATSPRMQNGFRDEDAEKSGIVTCEPMSVYPSGKYLLRGVK
ncbi:hypothetical protein C0Q70_01107 [Pomacea canaliculata]|uniref:Uncharacterized protein n=1 Tax=Pomacea canaliculata TaxID=400727 RepID=A0A2T7PYI6_POMCA|nr:hypothetical protein C0Q70_01107 [Pomacea canaliculata]